MSQRDDEDDGSPRPCRITDDWRAEGWLLRRWMRQEVAGDPRDGETWAILEELADAAEREKLSYKEVAQRHGITEAQLYKRVERLREKYRRRYDRWRSGVFVALLRWGAALVVGGLAVACVLWRLLHAAPAAPPILRDPDELRPAPSASASDTPFEPAQPT